MQLPVAHFSDRAKRAMSSAEREARAGGADEVFPEHLLLALAKGEPGVARMALEACGVDLAKRIASIPVPGRSTAVAPDRPARVAVSMSSKMLHTLGFAKEEAAALGHLYLGTEHLLLGLLRLEESPGAEFLRADGITIAQIRSVLGAVLRGRAITPEPPGAT